MTEDRRLLWVALFVLLAVVAISFLATVPLAFLSFFFLPVLLVAYWAGRRTATLVAFLAVLFVAFLAVFYPEQFAAGEGVDRQEPAWLYLFVWGGFLVLTGYASGTLMERLEVRAHERQPAPGTAKTRLYNMGTLAIIKGYLRHDQVLQILEKQEREHKLFGEIAMTLGLLTRKQVDELLRMQQDKRW